MSFCALGGLLQPVRAWDSEPSCGYSDGDMLQHATGRGGCRPANTSGASAHFNSSGAQTGRSKGLFRREPKSHSAGLVIEVGCVLLCMPRLFCSWQLNECGIIKSVDGRLLGWIDPVGFSKHDSSAICY